MATAARPPRFYTYKMEAIEGREPVQRNFIMAGQRADIYSHRKVSLNERFSLIERGYRIQPVLDAPNTYRTMFNSSSDGPVPVRLVPSSSPGHFMGPSGDSGPPRHSGNISVRPIPMNRDRGGHMSRGGGPRPLMSLHHPSPYLPRFPASSSQGNFNGPVRPLNNFVLKPRQSLDPKTDGDGNGDGNCPGDQSKPVFSRHSPPIPAPRTFSTLDNGWE